MLDMSQYRRGRIVKLDAFRAGFTKCVSGVEPLGQYGPELSFSDGDRLTLNSTNLNVLLDAYGDNGEDWIGHTVKGTISQVPIKNKQTGAIEMQDAGLLVPVTKPGEQRVMPKVARPRPQDFGTQAGDPGPGFGFEEGDPGPQDQDAAF